MLPAISDPSRAPVIVVGAGIAGLSAAWTLARAGAPVTVLEAAPVPGGHARTVREDGYVVERGPNGFLARADEPEPMALVRHAGVAAACIDARPEAARRFVWDRGRLRRLPESPPGLVTTNALSPAGKLRLLMEPFAPGPPKGDDETVFEFAARRIGREAAERLVDTAISGISAGDSRELSVAAAFPRMVAMEREHGSLIRAMMAKRGARPRHVSFDGGLATLVEALAADLGGRLIADAQAVALARSADGWRVTTRHGGHEAARVVLAVPAWHARTLLQPLDAVLGETLGTIPAAGMSMVALAWEAGAIGRPLSGYGFLVSRTAGLDSLGVVWESSLFAGRAPAGHVLLRVMMGGVRRPGVAERDKATLVAQARAELQRTMGVTAPPLRTWVARHPHAIAQYTRGHRERVAAARARAHALGGLTLCGTSYDGVSFTSAIVSGVRAAHAAAGADTHALDSQRATA